MIVKKIKTKITGKSRHYQIGDLVDYIRHPYDRNPEEKIIHSGSRNFISRTHNGQKLEMINLANESKYSEMPVTHWVFSWPESENPAPGQVDEMVDIFLEEMGLEGHQVVYGLHGNTENIHLHIAVNRMNEETGLVVRPNNGFDIIQAHKTLAIIEDTFGWKPEDNAVFRVVDGEVVKQAKKAKFQPSQPAQTFEQHTGMKSAERIAQEEAHAIILGATSWEDLHTKLAPLGMRYIKKGSGAIIQVDDTPVKASSVDRAFALGKMEKRLGKFVPGVYEEEQTHPRPPEPVSEVNLDEWRIYQEEMEKHDVSAIRQQERKVLEEKRRQIDAEAKARHAKVGKIIGKYGMYVGNIARNAIKEERRQKRATLLREHRRNQRKLATRPTFKKWLNEKGLRQQTDKWRYRKRIEQLAKQETLPQVMPSENPIVSANEAYQILFQNILEQFGNENMDISRVDSMIAVMLRANGYNKEEVTTTIEQCAPTIRNKADALAHKWDDYARRATAYAYGPAGDIALQNLTEQGEQVKIQSGKELAEQIKQKKQELKDAQSALTQARNKLDSAKNTLKFSEASVRVHDREVSEQGFFSGIINAPKNFLQGRGLAKSQETATQNVEIATKDYDEQANVVSNIKTELSALEKAFANTPLGREQKRKADRLAEQKRQAALLAEQERQKAERLKKEQEEQRQQASVQLEVVEKPQQEDSSQQYQVPSRRMRF